MYMSRINKLHIGVINIITVQLLEKNNYRSQFSKEIWIIKILNENCFRLHTVNRTAL